MALNDFEITKTLTPSDVRDKVMLPVKIMDHMGEHSMDLTAFDRWGKQWQLKYYTRPNGERKPVFTAGWRQLVTDNGVLPGDELIFSGHKVAGEMPYYMIQVKRKEGEIDVEVIKTVRGEPVNYF